MKLKKKFYQPKAEFFKSSFIIFGREKMKEEEIKKMEEKIKKFEKMEEMEKGEEEICEICGRRKKKYLTGNSTTDFYEEFDCDCE